MAEVGGEPSNPLGPVRRRFGDAAAFARMARAPRRALRTRARRGARDIFFRKNGNRGKRETPATLARRRRLARPRRSPGAVATRGEFGRAGKKKGKSPGAGDNPLISLETAKENVWNSLEKAWKSLEFPWKGLEKLKLQRQCA
jgi:hypothetical protein